MRIAWLGPAHESGGVPGMGLLLLEGVLDHPVEIDFYTTKTRDQIPSSIRNRDNLGVVSTPSDWQWNRWYSRGPFSSFLSSAIVRARAYRRLSRMLIERNANHPYDCIFQFSQMELIKLGRPGDRLPPIVVYPCVHAAGELHWHRRESSYALRSEKWWMHYLTRAILAYRSRVQKHEVQKPAMLIGMSRRFNEWIARDYGVNPQRQAVLYHPIRSAASDAPPTADRPEQGPIRALFVARISVRKGLDQIVELSRRLDDMADQITIEVIGDRTQWSDYRAHLKDMNPRICRYVGELPHDQVMAEYDRADLLLLPSFYEPGGLVVGEALSRGMCAVVSDEVGSGEPIDEAVCRKFPAGNLGEFEKQVRKMVGDLRERRKELRHAARREAQEHFAPDKIAAQLFELLRSVCADRPKIAAGAG